MKNRLNTNKDQTILSIALLLTLMILGCRNAYGQNLPPETNLVREGVEQNLDVRGPYNNALANGVVPTGTYNETYQGIKNFWNYDIVGNLFANVGQLAGKWLSEWVDGWVSDIVGFLTGALRAFVLNPNIALSGNLESTDHGNPEHLDDISSLIRRAASVIYAIAVDLLLLLFVLAIWRYWTEAAWKGGMGVMGAVGRLIFTFGITLAWPTLCSLEIQLSNEMIQGLWSNGNDQGQLLDLTLSGAVKTGILASSVLMARAFLPTLGTWMPVHWGVAIGGVISMIGLIVLFILGTILIIQLVIMLVAKAIQTALIAAQFIFAPIFLVFFAIPDTEAVASGFVKACIEVSLWTFAWVGLLKLMTILLLSSFSPWGKIVIAVGILHIMIQVPSFLARASISPLSPFISPGLIAGGLKAGAFQLAQVFCEKSMALTTSMTGARCPALPDARASRGASLDASWMPSSQFAPDYYSDKVPCLARQILKQRSAKVAPPSKATINQNALSLRFKNQTCDFGDRIPANSLIGQRNKDDLITQGGGTESGLILRQPIGNTPASGRLDRLAENTSYLLPDDFYSNQRMELISFDNWLDLPSKNIEWQDMTDPNNVSSDSVFKLVTAQRSSAQASNISENSNDQSYGAGQLIASIQSSEFVISAQDTANQPSAFSSILPTKKINLGEAENLSPGGQTNPIAEFSFANAISSDRNTHDFAPAETTCGQDADAPREGAVKSLRAMVHDSNRSIVFAPRCLNDHDPLDVFGLAVSTSITTGTRENSDQSERNSDQAFYGQLVNSVSVTPARAALLQQQIKPALWQMQAQPQAKATQELGDSQPGLDLAEAPYNGYSEIVEDLDGRERTDR